MKKTIIALIIIFVVAAGIFYLMQSGKNGVAEKNTIFIDGSSTVFPITEAMAEEFQKENPNTQVVVGISGTGGGFKRFCRGETHISNASRPIKESEAELCAENNIQYIEVPVAFDGMAVMVHPSNDWVDYFTVEELKKIWEPSAQNNITQWDQIRPEWPDQPINLYGPGADSGTYDYFTQAVVGEEGASRGDFVASEDDNVLVQGISSDPLSLGFFGYAYYKENSDKLKLIPISPESSGTIESAVFPTVETINNGSYHPLSRPIFIYVSLSAAENSWISDFINFYLNWQNAQSLVSEVGYIPLPQGIYDLAKKRFENKITGSIFENAGSQIGVTLDQLLIVE